MYFRYEVFDVNFHTVFLFKHYLTIFLWKKKHIIYKFV